MIQYRVNVCLRRYIFLKHFAIRTVRDHERVLVLDQRVHNRVDLVLNACQGLVEVVANWRLIGHVLSDIKALFDLNWLLGWLK